MSRPVRRAALCASVLALVLLLDAADAHAQVRRARSGGGGAGRGGQPFELAVTYGSMWGGDLRLVRGRLRTGTGPSYGVVLDVPVGPGRTVALGYTRQDGSLDLDLDGLRTLSDMSVNHWHLSGSQVLRPGRVQPFVLASIGATHFSPERDAVEVEGDTYRLESATKLSFALGLGAKAWLGANERFGLRATFKVIPTLYNTGSGIWVGPGGGGLSLTGDALWQWEAAGGLVVKLGG